MPGSWAASVFDAADRGEIDMTEARNMVIDFIAPSLDTTILASTHMLWLLGENPEAWQRLRREPELVPAAVVEAVRLASPIRGFTRRLSRDAEFGGVRMRAGDRAVLLFGAANLDERRYPDPERFDLHRPPGGNLGWGHGPHTCVGIHLAKLEMAALLRALVAQVETIEIAGRPVGSTTTRCRASAGCRFGWPEGGLGRQWSRVGGRAAALVVLAMAAALAGCGGGEDARSRPLTPTRPAQLPRHRPHLGGSIPTATAMPISSSATRRGSPCRACTAIDVRVGLHPHPLPGPGGLISAAGPVQTGTYGQSQIHASSCMLPASKASARP